MSSIKIINIKGPKTDPCTPLVTASLPSEQ